MSPVLVVITDVLIQQPSQMSAIQHDHMIQEISTYTANPALGNSVLPGTAECGANRLAALVGSRTGAALSRFSLAVAPRFLWECLSSQTVSRFPAPASSNPSCRFPAMGLPVCFTVKGYETASAGWTFR